MIKTKTWILIFSVLLLLCLAVTGILAVTAPKGSTVQVLQDGICIREIDLAQVTQSFTFTVEDDKGGSNVILVEPGRICILEADCPDRVCVRRGWLSDSTKPIVCLPHRLVIQSVEESGLDTMAE